MQGKKRRISFGNFNLFLKNRYLISYASSQVIKNGFRIVLVLNGVEVSTNNGLKFIGCLSNYLSYIKKPNTTLDSVEIIYGTKKQY